MNLYLPVKIRGTKMHVLKLQVPQNGNKIKPIFSFIVERASNRLLNIDTDTPILISDSGATRNINISDHSFFIKRENIKDIEDYIDTTYIKDMPLYRASIVSVDDLKNNADNAKGCSVKLPTGNPKEDFLSLAADNRVENNFVLIIDYTDVIGNTYLNVIRYYMYDNGGATAASIDFGSEASQVRFVNTVANENLVSLFKDIAASNLTPDAKKTWMEAHRFWQGSDTGSNTGLFKSVFFINQQPGMTKFGDIPMKNGNKTFVQILNKNEAEAVADLEVYPNSKLLEIAGENLGLSAQRIRFDRNNDREVIAVNPSISDGEQQEKISRIITSQFLYAIIHKIKDSEVCLRLILLVPNVYYQYKVHYLMESLYQDFDIFKQNDESIKLRGLEVDVLSESDASFLGYNQSEKIKKGEYILIIDAGKGTTDFSILQKIDTDKKYRGVYRNGIPASGNVVTYSFYEALVDYCKKYWNTDVVELLKKETARGDKIQFMDLLEVLKAEYSNTNKPKQNIESKSQITNLPELNAAIRSEFIDKGNHIPNIDFYIGSAAEWNKDGEQKKTNIQKITTMLYEKLDLFMQDNPGVKFAGSILTGRGFLFDPFAESIKQMLVDSKWIENKNLIHRINDITAKNICVRGAFSSNQSFNINNNSSLISYPIVSIKSQQNFFGRLMQIIGVYKMLNFIHRMYSPVSKEDAFFYNGITTYGKEQLVNISGRKYRIEANLADKCTLFFVGEHFLWQIGDDKVELLECKKSIADNRSVEQTDDNLLTTELVIKSLFPFVDRSIDIADFIDPQIEIPSQADDSSTSDNAAGEDIHSQQEPEGIITDNSFGTSGDQNDILS